MVVYSSNWLILFPIACCLFIALRMAQGTRDAHGPSFAQFGVRGLIALMFLFSLLAIGLRASILSVVWITILGIFAVIMLAKHRRLQRTTLLLTAMHATSIAEQQALVGLVVQEGRGWMRRKAGKVRRDLGLGMDWSRSLEFRGIAKGVYERLALRLQERYGAVHDSNTPRARAFVLRPNRVEAEAERLLGRLTLFSWVLMATPLLALIATFILPTVKQMYDEFGLELPPLLSSLVAISKGFTEWTWTALTVGTLLGFGSLLATCMLLWSFPSLMQLVPFRLLARDYYRNAGLTALAATASREGNLVAACRAAAAVIPLPFVSESYVRAADALERGMPPTQALVEAGVIRTRDLRESALCLDVDDPAWSFQQFAMLRIDRMLRIYSAASQVGLVVVTLLLAIVVGVVAVGFMQMLSNLITSLS